MLMRWEHCQLLSAVWWLSTWQDYAEGEPCPRAAWVSSLRVVATLRVFLHVRQSELTKAGQSSAEQGVKGNMSVQPCRLPTGTSRTRLVMHRAEHRLGMFRMHDGIHICM